VFNEVAEVEKTSEFNGVARVEVTIVF